jgi:hypothetical protein
VSRTRVFVAYSFARLEETLERSSRSSAGELGLLRRHDEAHAVTEALRAEFPGIDDEDLEYLAMTAAAQRSLALVPADGPHSRMVLAVDVGSVEEVGADDPTLVAVSGQVPLTDLVSVHVDSDDAAKDVRAARTALAEGTDQDDVRVTKCLEHELGWYAATELDEVVRRAAGARSRPDS